MDDKRLNELLDSASASLTGEQYAKAKACMTETKLLDLLRGKEARSSAIPWNLVIRSSG